MAEPNESAKPDQKEIVGEGAPIAMYDASKQISLEGGDFATVVNTERTRVLHEISKLTGVSRLDMGGDGLNWALENINKSVGERFQAHGFAKFSVYDLVSVFDKGLTKDRTFFSVQFYDTKSSGNPEDYTPKTEGGIIAVSNYDQHFPKEGDPGIKYIILGEEYINTVDLFKEKYQDRGVTVVPWHDAPKVLTEEYNRHNPDNPQEYQTVDPNKPIRHPSKRLMNSVYDDKTDIPIPVPTASNDTDAPEIW